VTATEHKTDASTIVVRNPADGRVVGAVPIETSEAVAAKARELRLGLLRASAARGVRR